VADRHYVAGRHGDELGVTAVAGPAHAAEDGDHGGPGGEPPTRIGLDRPGAFDARDLGDIPPAPVAHVGLGVVQAERPDPDQDLVLGGHRIWQLGDGQYLRAAMGRDDDGLHVGILS